jgi:hypothetical protein
MNLAVAWSSKLIRRIFFTFDALQRRRFGVWEYTDDPRCIVRIQRVASPSGCTLTDGAVISKGDPCIAIHYWNENVPMMGKDGADMRWAMQFISQMELTLRALAQYLESPEFADVVAIRGETSVGKIDVKRFTRFYNRLGFDFGPLTPASFGQRLAFVFETLYMWILIYAVNPGTLRGRPFYTAPRMELWMSRAKLRERYGAEALTPGPSPNSGSGVTAR